MNQKAKSRLSRRKFKKESQAQNEQRKESTALHDRRH
jgi:hypothetical protein